MTEKELRKLNRAELLEMLISQMRENESLRAELERERTQIQTRELKIAESGSIAEAALRLQGVFEAAQAAADQYVASVKSAVYESAQSAAEQYAASVKSAAEQYAASVRTMMPLSEPGDEN